MEPIHIQWHSPIPQNDPKLWHLYFPRANITQVGKNLRVRGNGKGYTIPIQTRGGTALDVLYDPVQPDRIIVMRKTGKRNEPYGRYTLYSISRTHEIHIGEWTLLRSTEPGIALTRRLMVQRNVSNVPARRTPEIEKLWRKSEGWLRKKAIEYRHALQQQGLPREQIAEQVDLFLHTERASANNPDYLVKRYGREPNRKAILKRVSQRTTYNYEENKLAVYLITTFVHMAQNAGLKAIESGLSAETTAKFMPRYGWKRMRGYPGFYRKRL